VSANFIFLVNLAEKLASLVDGLGHEFLSTFGGNSLRKRLVHGLGCQLFAVVNCRRARVFLRNHVAFLSILPQEFKEALVASNLDHGDLEVVPSLIKERLHVALELEEGLGVRIGAIGADKSAEGHVEMGTPVVLAVDAVGVELLLGDAFAKVGTHFGTLDVTLQSGVGHGRVAH